MIESQWLSATARPMTMLAHVDRSTGPRKQQLIAAAGLRLVEELLPDEVRSAIGVLERSADSDATIDGLYRTLTEVRAYRRAHLVDGGTWESWQTAAQYALVAALDPTARPGNRRCLEWVITARSLSVKRGEKLAIRGEVRQDMCAIIREIVGNPFRPWQVVPSFLGGGRIQPDGTVVHLSESACALTEQIHGDQAFDRLPVLADALEESGITDAGILEHCRSETTHLRGCWALDAINGK